MAAVATVLLAGGALAVGHRRCSTALALVVGAVVGAGVLALAGVVAPPSPVDRPRHAGPDPSRPPVAGLLRLAAVVAGAVLW